VRTKNAPKVNFVTLFLSWRRPRNTSQLRRASLKLPPAVFRLPYSRHMDLGTFCFWFMYENLTCVRLLIMFFERVHAATSFYSAKINTSSSADCFAITRYVVYAVPPQLCIRCCFCWVLLEQWFRISSSCSVVCQSLCDTCVVNLPFNILCCAQDGHVLSLFKSHKRSVALNARYNTNNCESNVWGGCCY